MTRDRLMSRLDSWNETQDKIDHKNCFFRQPQTSLAAYWKHHLLPLFLLFSSFTNSSYYTCHRVIHSQWLHEVDLNGCWMKCKLVTAKIVNKHLQTWFCDSSLKISESPGDDSERSHLSEQRASERASELAREARGERWCHEVTPTLDAKWGSHWVHININSVFIIFTCIIIREYYYDAADGMRKMKKERNGCCEKGL